MDTPALRRYLKRLPHAAGDRLTPGVDSIAITGYTDTVGSSEYNQRLSLRRVRSGPQPSSGNGSVRIRHS